MAAQPTGFGYCLDLVQGRTELHIVLVADTVETFGASPDDQMRRTEFGGAVGGTGNPGQLFRQDIVEDEIAAGIGGHQRKAGFGEKVAKVGGAVVKQIAIEQFDAFISCRGNVVEGAVHVAECAIGELRNRGHALRIATKHAPAIGVISQLPIRHFEFLRCGSDGFPPRPKSLRHRRSPTVTL